MRDDGQLEPLANSCKQVGGLFESTVTVLQSVSQSESFSRVEEFSTNLDATFVVIVHVQPLTLLVIVVHDVCAPSGNTPLEQQ